MATHYSQELLQALSPALYINIIKLVQAEENLPRKWRNDHSGSFLLQDLAEYDKVAVSSANFGLSLFKSWNVCSAHYFIVSEGFLPVVGDRISYLRLVTWDTRQLDQN